MTIKQIYIQTILAEGPVVILWMSINFHDKSPTFLFFFKCPANVFNHSYFFFMEQHKWGLEEWVSLLHTPTLSLPHGRALIML